MTNLTGPWVQLAFAIVLEIAGTLLLKLSDGFSKWHLGVAAIALYAVCFRLMAALLEHIPVGVAYAIWSGAGIVAITAIGTVLFGERLQTPQLLFIGLIVAGCAGLRMTTAAT